ncbi:hypothetical protein HDU87_007396 [Geranomyces variabilis]|uniref:Uncharacterized protein n=1 Tax=Geranomyces variabilis TaxID=109894 RepID=A0AAD5XTK7_9FUNG|nr:hypothetical protein HDU87_007396 [Geranomyces variabilis]
MERRAQHAADVLPQGGMPQARPLLPAAKTGSQAPKTGPKLSKHSRLDENSKPQLPAKVGLSRKRVNGSNLGRKTLELINAAERVSQTLQILDRSETPGVVVTPRVGRSDEQGRVEKETAGQKVELAEHTVVDESQQTDDIVLTAPPVHQILSSIFQKDDNAGSFFRSSLRAPDAPPKKIVKSTAPPNPNPQPDPEVKSIKEPVPTTALPTGNDLLPGELSEPGNSNTQLTSEPLIENTKQAPSVETQPVPQPPPPPPSAPPSWAFESETKNDRLVKFLERENNELRQQLLAEKSPKPQDTQFTKQMDYLTDENQELRKENQALGFLRRRVQQLENDNRYLQMNQATTLKPASTCSRCASLEVKLSTMQSEASRHHIELKAVMDQNTYMREENTRLSGQNDILRAELLQNAKSQAVSEAQRQEIYDLVKEEKRLVENEIWKHPSQSPQADLVSQSSGAESRAVPVLKQMLNALSSVHSTGSTSQFPDAIPSCRGLIRIIGLTSRALVESERETKQLDQRIAQLRRQTQATVDEISEHYEQEMKVLRSDNRELERQLEELLSEKKRRQRETPSAEISNKPAPSEPSQPARPDNPLSSDMAKHEASTKYQKQAEQLAAANARLQSNQAHLESLVSKWKDENASLRRTLRSVPGPPNAEAEHIRLLQKIQELSTQLEDQKLLTDKANELITSLRTELEVARATAPPDFIKELERSWSEKMKELQQASPNAAHQLAQLTSMVEEHVAQLAAVRDENIDLQQSVAKLRAKLKKQEETWTEKCKAIQDDLHALQGEHAKVTHHLQDYERQHQKIVMLSTITDISDSLNSQSTATADAVNHPLGFDAHFLYLHDAHAALRHQTAALHQKLSALSALAETRLQENRVLDARHENERAQIETLQRAIEQQMRRIEGLQKDLVIVQEGKQCAEVKLANILKGYQQLVAPLRSI